MDNYKTMDLTQWTHTGEGTNSDAYTSDDKNYMLKVFKHNATEKTAKKDYEMAAKVASLGVPTARVFEIVKIGEKYGVLYQNLKNKKSYSRLAADDPAQIASYAQRFAKKAKELHALPCDTSFFEGKKSILRKAVENAKFIGPYKQKLFSIIDGLSDCTTCLHGDLQSGNLVYSEGNDYWIDLDRFSCGDPLLDTAHIYGLCINLAPMKRIQNLLHLSQDQLREFWYAYIQEYYGYSKEETDVLTPKWEVLHCLDLLQKCYTQPSLQQDLVCLLLVRPRLRKNLKLWDSLQ